MSADRLAELAAFCAAAARCGEEWPEQARRFAARHGAPLGRELLRTLSLFVGIPPMLRALDAASGALAARGDPAPRAGADPAALGREAFARVYGPDAQPVLARLGELDPTLRDWVIEHAYGRGYAGAGLDLAERERLAVLALAAGGCWKQCESHLRACLRLGVPAETLRADAMAGGWLAEPERAELRRRIAAGR